MLNHLLLELSAARHWHSLRSRTHACRQIQADFQSYLMRKLGQTRHGTLHGLSSGVSVGNWHNLPLRDYEGFRPWIEDSMQGQADLLWPGQPDFFQVTSGTTDKPKYIPFTDEARKRGARLVRLWMLLACRENQAAFKGRQLFIPGRAIEGYTKAGIPFGSASGQAYKDAPSFLKRNYAVPYEVFEETDYGKRSLSLLRHALTQDVRFIMTANPVTILRLVQIARDHGAALIETIHNGRDFCEQNSHRNAPNPQRARALEKIIVREGALQLHSAWPNLALIACWMGGSIGWHADRLRSLFPGVPFRDPGYHASEARMSVPLENQTAAGLLAVTDNFFEFLPATEDAEQPQPDAARRTIAAHELERDQEYRIIVSNETGLLRYDLKDLIVVRGFEGSIPMVEFRRKIGDASNLVGEKLHANQCLQAYQTLRSVIRPSDDHFYLVPSLSERRYDLYCEFEDPPLPQRCAQLAGAYEDELCRINPEYASRRASGRLQSLRLQTLPAGSMGAQMQEAFQSGQREAQFKWRILRQAAPETAATPVTFGSDRRLV